MLNDLEGRSLAVADLATGLALLALGLVVAALSWAMPTFSERGADVLTAPGIFPGAIGVLLAIAGGSLALRSVGRLKSDRAPSPPAFTRRGVIRTAVGFALMAAAVVAAGHLDFRLIVGGFCLAFSAAFVPWGGTPRERVRRLAAVALVTLIAAVAIPTVFETIFLVRLP